jgi:hypothetical protein
MKQKERPEALPGMEMTSNSRLKVFVVVLEVCVIAMIVMSLLQFVSSH